MGARARPAVSPLRLLHDVEGRLPALATAGRFVWRPLSRVLPFGRRHLRAAVGIVGLAVLGAHLWNAAKGQGPNWRDLATSLLLFPIFASLDAPPAATRWQHRLGGAGSVLWLLAALILCVLPAATQTPTLGFVCVALLIV